MSDEIPNVPVPADLSGWVKEQGLGTVSVHATDIALAITITLPQGAQPSLVGDRRDALRHLSSVVREAGREARMPWPLVLILDASACITDERNTWPTWHAAVDDLANDQEWHGGDLSLYLVPVVAPGTDWLGPEDAAALRALLLDVGAQIQKLPEIVPVTKQDLDAALRAFDGDVPADLRSALMKGPDALRAWTQRRVREVDGE